MSLYLVTPLTEADLGSSADLYTGDKVMPVPEDFDYDGGLTIKQSRPMPLTILFVLRKGNTY